MGLCLGVGLFAGLASAQTRPQTREQKEPDFAFISGSAYTQVRNSIQFIYQNAYGTRRFSSPGGRLNQDEFAFFLRTEYGLTDRWEVDFVTPGAGNRTRLNGHTVASDYALADWVLGMRYRLLEEGRAPFTLATGPQLLLPSGSVRRGTGTGATGLAWDVAASKDWGGPVFFYSTLNYHLRPSASDTTRGSTERFVLHGLDWATAIGLRALERPSGGSKYGVHVFLEAGGSWNQEVDSGQTAGTRRGMLAWAFSPGIRFGYLTSRRTLIEIGVAVPVGLGPNGPKKSILVQFQFEKLFSPPKPD